MLDASLLQGMLYEMSKEALLGGIGRAVGSHLQRSAGNIGAGIGLGALGGGLIGGIRGAARGYQGDGEEDSGGTLGALAGGLSGVSRGALLGGAAGGLAGLASGGRGSGGVQSVLRGKYNPLGIAGREGQRQLHTVTGLVPGGAQRGTPEYAKALTALNVAGLGNKAKAVERESNPQRTLLGRVLGKPAPEVNQRRLSRATSAYGAAVGAAQFGQTSLAGIGKNFADKGALGGARDLVGAVKAHVAGASPLGKAALIGGAAAPLAMAALQPTEGEAPEDIGTRYGDAVGRSAAGALTPLVGGAGAKALGTGAGAVGGAVGKVIGKVVGAVKPGKGPGLGNSMAAGAQPDLAPPPIEREYTNAALGKPPEGLQ